MRAISNGRSWSWDAYSTHGPVLYGPANVQFILKKIQQHQSHAQSHAPMICAALFTEERKACKYIFSSGLAHMTLDPSAHSSQFSVWAIFYRQISASISQAVEKASVMSLIGDLVFLCLCWFLVLPLLETTLPWQILFLVLSIFPIHPLSAQPHPSSSAPVSISFPLSVIGLRLCSLWSLRSVRWKENNCRMKMSLQRDSTYNWFWLLKRLIQREDVDPYVLIVGIHTEFF